MSISNPQDKALAATSFLLRIGMWLSLTGVAFGMVSTELFVLFVAPAVALAAIAIVWRFFAVVQIRLFELLLMLVVLGNIVGWSFRANFFYGGNVGEYEMVAFGLTLALCLVWGVGSVTNGLLIAQRLKVEKTWERMEIIGLCLLFPLFVFALTASVLLLLIALIAPNPPCALCLPIGAFSFIFICYVHGLRKDAAAKRNP